MINLLYCANEGVFDGIMLSLLSAVKNTIHPLHVYILTMDLTQKNPNFKPLTPAQIYYLDEMLKDYNKDSYVALIDATDIFLSEMDNCPNAESGYTPYTLLRLLADLLPLPSHILYLDCDTMVCGDLGEILNYDITSYEIAGALDNLGRHFIAPDYINAGVLYLNLDIIKSTGLLLRCRKLCMEEILPFPDQDAINRLSCKKLIIPSIFNQQDKWHKDTIIQHFSKTIRFFPYFKIINIKPWDISLVHSTLKLTVYDQVFKEYTHRRSLMDKNSVPPIKPSIPLPATKQFKKDLLEVLSYKKQNGGIFRKKRKDITHDKG